MCSKTLIWTKSIYRPFCSKRCKIKDQAYWAEGAYKIEGEKVESETVLNGEETLEINF